MVLRTLVTWPIMVVLTGVAALMLVVVSWISPNSPLVEAIIRRWARIGIRLAGVRLEIRGAANIEPSQSYVFVGNHISVLDIFAHFYGLPVPARFLAKAELFRIPILAQGLRAIGIVEVDRRGTPGALERINTQARRAVSQGNSLIIYAEGTRSRDGELQRFKMGAFVIAASMELPIVPMTIHGTSEAMKADSLLVRGGPVILVIDEPIWPEGTERAEIARLARQTREVIAERYNDLRSQRAEAQS
ncbi:MAG: lysophospholipid acyltransferase family protein [Acidimicrobiia bacterium]